MVRLSELSKAPTEEKKNYLFTSNNSSKGGPKKEWQMERERRKLRAQKKEQRRKTLEETKEQEKNKWKSFNAKAMSKNMKVWIKPGFARIMCPDLLHLLSSSANKIEP